MIPLIRADILPLRKILLIALCALLCSFAVLARAQEKNEFSAELEEANLSVYRDAQKAVALSSYVYQHAKNIDTKIFALVTMVNGYTALQQNGKALKYASETWKLAQRSQNIQYRIWALGLLGEQYQLSHLNGISREYLDKAENLIQHSDLSKEAQAVSSGNIYAIKGNGYKDEIDCGYAVKIYDMAIASYQSVPDNSVARNNLALVFLEKGNCLLDLDNLKQAEGNFQKAYQLATQHGLEEYRHNAGIGLAKIAWKKGNFRTSTDSLERILSVIDTAQNPKIKTEIYYLLKENYLALNLPEQYRKYEQKHSRAASDVEKLGNAQFENVLHFVSTQPLPVENSTQTSSYLFYGLLLTTTVILGREFYHSKNKR